MAAPQDNFGLGPETPSRFVVGAHATPGLWSLGLKTGLTPQQLAPLSSGTHHKLEINPFEQSYASVRRKSSLVDDQMLPAPVGVLKRPRIDQLQHAGAGPSKDSSSSTESRTSTESTSRSDSRSVSAVDTPPSDVSPPLGKEDLSLLTIKSRPSGAVAPSLGLPSGAIDANAYAEHLARYVQAQAVHATRTSAPMAGRSTSKPQEPLAAPAPLTSFHQQPEMQHDDDHDQEMSSPVSTAYAHSPPPSSAPLPAAMSAVQPLPAAPPRKKSAPLKTTAKRGKVGRPRNVKEEEEGEEVTAEEAKRRDFLERNRQAACKSRQKRKAWQANLETEALRLTESNGQLQALVGTLREEIASLRATVAGHAANGCQAARLALQAARPGDVPMAAFVLPSPSVAGFSPSLGRHPSSGDFVVSRGGGSSLEDAVAFHRPTTMDVQRSNSSSAVHELSPVQSGAGASYYDIAMSTSSHGHRIASGRGDVDLSAYLA